VRRCSHGGACERGACEEMLREVLVRRLSRGAHKVALVRDARKEVLVRRCSQGGTCEDMLTRRCL
jgi:hypothetical protein